MKTKVLFSLVPTAKTHKDNPEGINKFFALYCATDYLTGGDVQEAELTIRSQGRNRTHKAWCVRDRCTAMGLIKRASEAFCMTLLVASLQEGSEFAEFVTENVQ